MTVYGNKKPSPLRGNNTSNIALPLEGREIPPTQPSPLRGGNKREGVKTIFENFALNY